MGVIRLIIMLLFIGSIFSQETEKKDTTFIVLKSGDSVKVKKIAADIGIQPPIEFNLRFFGFDTTKYDISDVRSVYNTEGKIILSKNIISIMKFIRWSCRTLISVCLIYYIIV